MIPDLVVATQQGGYVGRVFLAEESDQVHRPHSGLEA